MVYSFARIGATLGMTVFTQNRRLWVWLREKGGKHAMPCHHNLYKNNPPVNQARATGEVRLDDEIGPYEAERLAVLAVNGPLPSNFVAARLSDTENCT